MPSRLTKNLDESRLKLELLTRCVSPTCPSRESVTRTIFRPEFVSMKMSPAFASQSELLLLRGVVADTRAAVFCWMRSNATIVQTANADCLLVKLCTKGERRRTEFVRFSISYSNRFADLSWQWTASFGERSQATCWRRGFPTLFEVELKWRLNWRAFSR